MASTRNSRGSVTARLSAVSASPQFFPTIEKLAGAWPFYLTAHRARRIRADIGYAGCWEPTDHEQRMGRLGRVQDTDRHERNGACRWRRFTANVDALITSRVTTNGPR